MNEVYKINDVINCEFLKIPKSMFANEKYKILSSDAKLTFALLYDRLSLSKLNGWINDKDEVYLIYTREEIAEELGITYKKAIAAFKELLGAELISETRCGRGFPNRIYIVKPKTSVKAAKDFSDIEKTRYAKTEVQEEKNKTFQKGISYEERMLCDMQNGKIKICPNGTSEPAVLEVFDMPEPHANHTYINQNNINQHDTSQSVNHSERKYRLTDGNYSLEEITANCQLDTFPEDEQRILYDALERMYYSETLRVGNAVYPQGKIRSRMYEINAGTLESAMANLHKNNKPIRNYQRYVMSTIFNCIAEDFTVAAVDPFLNSLRKNE